MSEQENVELVKQGFAAFQRGDIATVLNFFSDDIDFRDSMPAEIWPWAGKRRGRAQAAEFYAGLAAWFPLREAPLLIGIVSLAGLVLLVCWLLWRRGRRRRPRSPFDQGSDVFDKLPYGVAIAAGAVIAFAFAQ